MILILLPCSSTVPRRPAPGCTELHSPFSKYAAVDNSSCLQVEEQFVRPRSLHLAQPYRHPRGSRTRHGHRGAPLTTAGVRGVASATPRVGHETREPPTRNLKRTDGVSYCTHFTYSLLFSLSLLFSKRPHKTLRFSHKNQVVHTSFTLCEYVHIMMFSTRSCPEWSFFSSLPVYTTPFAPLFSSVPTCVQLSFCTLIKLLDSS